MNDIFYFSEKEISLKNLYDFLSISSSNALFLNKNQDAMQVELKSGNGRWDILQMDISRDFADPDSAMIILETNAKTAFCISHHSYTLEELKSVLKLVLERYGGWVGNDSHEFYPRFTTNNISSLSY